MYDAIVIGAGLFGQLIAHGLRQQSKRVLVIDADKPHAGSPPAACLIRKEWSGKLPDGVFEAGMKFLGDNFLCHEKELFQFGNTKTPRVTAFWFNPRDLLFADSKAATVDPISPDMYDEQSNSWTLTGTSFAELHAHQVIVAAGVWSQDLVPWYNMQLVGKAGLALLYRDVKQPNFIVPWAPYKQIVGFDRGDGFWVSDGSAILTDNWTEQRKRESRDRCMFQMKEGSAAVILEHKELFGIRPYTVQQPCICEQVKPGLWVAVGARKNGTLLGAWCAQKIVKEST